MEKEIIGVLQEYESYISGAKARKKMVDSECGRRRCWPPFGETAAKKTDEST